MASNAVVQAAGIPIQSVISLGTFAAITRYLGPSGFGDYTAVMVFLFIPTVIADVGLSAIVLRDVSAAPERMREIVNASLSLRALVSLFAVALTCALAFALPLDHRVRIGVLLGSPGAFLTLMNLSLLPVLQAQLRMHRSVVANVLGRSTILLLTIGVLALGLGFNSIIAANVLGLAVILIVNAAVVHRTLALRPAVDLVYWRGFLRSSLVLGVGLAVSQVFFRVDAVLLALLRPATDVGLYGAAYKFVELSQVFLNAGVLTLVPALTSLAARRDSRFEAVSRRGLEVLLAVSLPVSVVLLVMPRELLSWTAGSKYQPAAHALQILAPYAVLASANSLAWRMLIAAHLEQILLFCALGVLTLNVALNVALIPRYGYLAAAVTSVASEAVSLVLSFWFVRRRLAFSYPWRSLGVVVPAAAAMCLVGFLVPVPRLAAAGLGLALYIAVVAAAPGVVRDTVGQLIASTRARAL